ncbi:MAG TPA: septum formation initiator family protein [bacterium]|nr:septum formation initiator family protein [bacterium]
MSLPKISLVVTVNLIILAFLFVGFGREYWRNIEIQRDIAALQAESDRLAGQKLESLSLINDLSSEYYLEGEARTKRGMGEPGEQLVIVDLPDQVKPEGEVLGIATDESISNPTRWWYYFFNPTRFDAMTEL